MSRASHSTFHWSSMNNRAATHSYLKTSKRSTKANKHFRKQFTGKSEMSNPNDERLLCLQAKRRAKRLSLRMLSRMLMIRLD